MTTITATTILSSQLAQDPTKRLTGLLCRYPRWIHAEGRTHRLLDIGEDFGIEVRTPSLMECDDLSRNASSSRAVPVAKLIQDILDDPAVPVFWGKNVAGMQAREELGSVEKAAAYDTWMRSMESAIAYAKAMCALGIDDDGKIIGAHKQIVNRMLEPYSHITVVVSATEWSNFLALRDHGDAEPHIRLLAQTIRVELEKPAMQVLQPGEWHLPFTEDVHVDGLPTKVVSGPALQNTIKLAVSRCASTSYKTVEGFDMTLDRAIALHDKLVSSAPLHASPAEHVAQADDIQWAKDKWANPQEHGNFVGFRQYRKMLPNETL